LRRRSKLQAEINSYLEKQRALQEENQALLREIKSLSGDWKALEKAAREDLGLVRESDVVFTFE
jgi:cell division protein FtsB